jgi:dipeptidyl aminopeptidase/acylaminoacyl peptidase
MRASAQALVATLFAAVLSAAALPAAAQSKPSEIPVETFFKRADLSNMVLSPDGKHVAALKNFKGRENIVVVSLADRKPFVITSFENFDVVDFRWINNKRVFFRVAEIRDVLGNIRYQGTYAIDIDGQNLRNLSDAGRAIKQGTMRVNNVLPLARPLGEPDSDDMYIGMYTRYDGMDVYRMDTRTGRTKESLTLDAPAYTNGFVLDWKRVPRIAFTTDDRAGKNAVWYRETKESPWVELMSWGMGSAVEQIRPIAFNADNKTLFIASNIGRDKAAIYTYDPATKKIGDLVFEHPNIDIWGGLRFDPNTQKLIGIGFNYDKPEIIWIDPEYKKVQAQVDAALPKTINALNRGQDDPNRFVIFSWSDTDPGKFYLLTRTPKTSMEELLPARPDLKPELMAPRKFIKYKARDGLEIAAWLTLPKGEGKNLPLVVNIHGGPWARVYGGYDWGRPEAEFLASRGYAVLEPEPRGSTGFGRKAMQASYKMWGQSMQDDITDGALHLVKEGIVDKGRMCLYGASYGGYATLQGLVREPDLFRCGISFVAVTDLVEFLTSNESDTNMMTRVDLQSEVMWPQVGDPSKDRAMLVANSPAMNARKIKAPVLLAMGQIDIRVPLEHGRRMRSAMEEAGVKHEYLVYAGEGHGWNKDENVYDWYKRVEAFLKKHNPS